MSDAGEAHREHAPYSDQNPRPRRAGDFAVEVLSVTAGLDHWEEEVRTCVKRSSHATRAVGRGDWKAEGTDGRSYPAAAGGVPSLPTPVYPERKVLAPGQCVVGWWSIPLPKLPGGPAAIQFAPEGGPTLIEWPTLR